MGEEYSRNRKGNRSMHTQVVFVMGVIGAQGRLLAQCANKPLTGGPVAVTTATLQNITISKVWYSCDQTGGMKDPTW